MQVLEGVEVGLAGTLAVRVLLDDWVLALKATACKAVSVCRRHDL